MAKPPSTRHTVMPMSNAKPISVSSVQPERSIVSGSARKIGLTQPLKVAADHTRDEQHEEAHAERDAAGGGDRGAVVSSIDRHRRARCTRPRTTATAVSGWPARPP